MWLNEQFTVIRGHIYMITPPPSLSEVYGKLLQEEQQRDRSSYILPLENIAMAVKHYDSGNRNSTPNTKSAVDFSSLYYDFCHSFGHNREKCFCIHGYPDWNKLFGKPKPKPQSQQQHNKSTTQANN